MKSFTKILFCVGVILLAYGYLCRILHIYFFWDSKELGWIVLFITLLFYLIDLHKSRKRQKKKTIWVKIGIGFLLFGLIIFPVVLSEIKKSASYQAAIEYIKADTQIKNLVGNIKGFGLIPTGQSQSITVNRTESGDAIFNITVKGDKKYKDLTVWLKKTPEADWTVISIN